MSSGDIQDDQERSAPAVAPVARLWSPLVVAVYGLVLAFPASLVLAVKDWRELGMHKEARRHVLGALVVSLVLIGLLIFLPSRIARGIALAANFAVFFYLKEKLRLDIATASARDPRLVIRDRPWYTGVLWALPGLLLFLLLFVAIVFALTFAGLDLPD